MLPGRSRLAGRFDLPLAVGAIDPRPVGPRGCRSGNSGNLPLAIMRSSFTSILFSIGCGRKHRPLGCRAVYVRHRPHRSAAMRSCQTALRKYSPRRSAPLQSRRYRSGSASSRSIADRTAAAERGFHEQAVLFVLDELGNAAPPGGDDGQAALKGFEDNPRIALHRIIAGKQQQVVPAQHTRNLFRLRTPP